MLTPVDDNPFLFRPTSGDDGSGSEDRARPRPRPFLLVWFGGGDEVAGTEGKDGDVVAGRGRGDGGDGGRAATGG